MKPTITFLEAQPGDIHFNGVTQRIMKQGGALGLTPRYYIVSRVDMSDIPEANKQFAGMLEVVLELMAAESVALGAEDEIPERVKEHLAAQRSPERATAECLAFRLEEAGAEQPEDWCEVAGSSYNGKTIEEVIEEVRANDAL